MSEEKLPKGWKFKSLNDLNSGKSKNVDPARFPEKTFELYSVPQFEFSEPEYLKGSEVKSTKQKVEVGDVLISKINPRINRVWVVEDFSDHEKIASSEWIIVRPKDFIDPKYLKYAASAPFFRSLLQSEVSGVGGSLTRARPKIVANYRIPVAPLHEQQRIVAKLDAVFGHLDRVREKLDQIPELLKNFRQQVLTQAVTGELTREWREGKGLGEWEIKRINDLISKIEAGKNFSAPEVPVAEGKVGLVKISAVTWDEFDEKETKTVENKDQINPNYFIQKGDFLISRANTLELVGSSVIVNKINHKIMLSDKVWRVLFHNQTTKLFVNRFLKSPLGRKEIESRATGNQLSMRNLSQNNFKDIIIEIPPIEEQEEIIIRIDILFGLADKIKSQYHNLKAKIDQMPQAVLAKAFRGELVGQEVKEYVREIGELGMVAEGVEEYQNSPHLKSE